MINQINFKTVFCYTLPSMLSMIFLSFYVMVDGFFIAEYVGEYAFSSINITYPILSAVVAVGTMFGTGGNAVCATLLGMRQQKSACQKFTLFFVVGFTVGVIISVLTLFNLNALVLALGASENTYQHCMDYLGVIAFFMPFSVVQIIVQNGLIASGKPLLSFGSMLLGGITNVVLDYIFLAHLDMGIEGAALATGIGYMAPVIIGMIYFITTKKENSFKIVKFNFDTTALFKACSNGSSEMVTNLAMSITTFLFNTAMFKLAGDDGIAAITIVLYAQFLSSAIFIGFSQGISPVISFYYGENNIEKIKQLHKVNLIWIVIFSVLMVIASNTLSSTIATLFTEEGTEIFYLAQRGLMLLSISFLFSGVNIFTSNMFTAFSNGKISAFISFLRSFILIVGCILILPNYLGVDGIWLAIPLAEILTIIVSIILINMYKKVYKY